MRIHDSALSRAIHLRFRGHITSRTVSWWTTGLTFRFKGFIIFRDHLSLSSVSKTASYLTRLNSTDQGFSLKLRDNLLKLVNSEHMGIVSIRMWILFSGLEVKSLRETEGLESHVCNCGYSLLTNLTP